MEKGNKKTKLKTILFINICCILLITSIVGIFLLQKKPTMAAGEISTQLFVTFIATGKDPFRPLGNEYGTDFGMHGIQNTNIPVFCFDGPKDHINNDMVLDKLIEDPGVLYIVENGYPHKKLVTSSDFPNVSSQQVDLYNYFITQWAIWAYKHKYYGEGLPHSNDNNTLAMLQNNYGIFSQKFNLLLNGADAMRAKPKLTDITFSDTVTMNLVGDHYETSTIHFKSSTEGRSLERGSYQLEITAPSGYYIVTSDGTTISQNDVLNSSINLSKGFKIVIPITNITPSNLTVNVKVKVAFEPHFLRLYNSGIDSVQRGLLSTLYNKGENKEITTSLIIPTGKLKVEKITMNEQGQTEFVNGATLKIESPDDSSFTPVTWQTNGSREFSGLIPGKTYTVTEVTPPSGFIHNTSSKSYKLTAADSYTSGENVARITLQNEYTKICIKKVDAANTSVTIPNAVYDLVEKSSGRVVRTWTTTTGDTCFTRLPIGTYQIVERVAPTNQGYIVVPPKDITIGSVSSTQSFVSEEDYTKICINKVDKDNANIKISNARLQLVNRQTGAVYRDFRTTANATCYDHVPVGDYILQEIEAPTDQGYVLSPSKNITVEAIGTVQNYTLEDDYTKICIRKVDRDNHDVSVPNARLQLINKKTGAIYKSFTTKESETCYDHVPVGDYKLVEVEAPLAAGYVTSPSKDITVEAIPTRQDYTFEDDYTKVCIAKVDKYDHTKYVSGAKVKLVDKLTGEVVKSFTTTNEPQCYTRLAGGTYKLIETEAPTWEGYVTAPEREITIVDTREVQTFQFEDDYTKLCIRKVDKQDNLKPVVGARLHLFDKKTGKLIKSFTSREEETCFYKLPVGDYELMEEEAPGELGYVKMENRDIKLVDSEEKQLFMVDDDYTKLCIKKVNPETDELVAGAHLLLTGPNGYQKEFVTSLDEEKICVDHIPVGDYKLEEIKTPDGYITSPSKTFKINDGNENLIVMDDLLTRVKIAKLDGATGLPLSGVELALLDSNGKEVRNWFSTGEPYEIVGLPIGKYTLIEKSPLDGYVKIADYQFEIHDRVETVMINVVNDRIVEVPNTSTASNIFITIFGLLFMTSGGFLIRKFYLKNVHE